MRSHGKKFVCSGKSPALRGATGALRGMTLVELLVVIVILGILAGFMIPRIPGMVQGQRLREASRAVHVAISTARGRAMELRRPCGIRIENQPGSTLVRVVETRPGFSGFTENSMAMVTNVKEVTFPEGLPRYVQTGDRLLVGGRRPTMEITRDPVDSYVVSVPDLSLNPGMQFPYLITSNPGSPSFVGSSRRPVVLPAQTMVDLGWSGDDGGCWDTDPLRLKDPGEKASEGGYMEENGSGSMTGFMTSPTPDAVTILFEPDGAISRVIREYPKTAGGSRSMSTTRSTPGQTVWLMIGRPDQVDSDLATKGIQVLSDAKSELPPMSGLGPIDQTNIADADSRWVAISARNGRVVTAMNSPRGNTELQYFSNESGEADVWPQTEYAVPRLLRNARILASGGENVGGNR